MALYERRPSEMAGLLRHVSEFSNRSTDDLTPGRVLAQDPISIRPGPVRVGSRQCVSQLSAGLDVELVEDVDALGEHAPFKASLIAAALVGLVVCLVTDDIA
jgi:hypothetical protein